jgi:hypothetical protein
MHPATREILRFFEYDHLPTALQQVSKPFHDLAWSLIDVHKLAGAELTTGLRKLLEAKDCVVRAALSDYQPPRDPTQSDSAVRT